MYLNIVLSKFLYNPSTGKQKKKLARKTEARIIMK